MMLIVAKAKGFEWETAMALLFLGAKDRRIKASDLDAMKQQFARLNNKTSQEVLRFYRSRRREVSAPLDARRLRQLHST